MKRLSLVALATLALAAELSGAPPRPPSRVIESIEWAPKESISRAAKGSDRFPMTWAADDGQYTAWGDGKGFGNIAKKLSLGYARVSGRPEAFQAEDIRSESGEDFGDGRRGLKASGLLDVGGTLYLWVGNADRNGRESRLAWSTNGARGWTWEDWRFAEFGYVSLVNFGRGYAGARDEFVYGVAHDHPSEYEVADRFILMRAPKERLRERAAYEFLAGLTADGKPEWTRDIGQRGAMFSHPAACLRQQMTWCAPLRRYLWWQQLPNSALRSDLGDTRFEGGFGIYDAPEPWGPWTTAFFTNKWDVGPGETASFPAKWMSGNGKELWLVFSGDDCFSVRAATIACRSQPGGESADRYFPSSESNGGWRKLDKPEEVRGIARMNPTKLDELKEWLLQSDRRDFAAVVIRGGHIVLEVERGNSAKTDSRRVASVSKAVCATVLAIASEQSQQGLTPRKMSFDDRAFDFIPWAKPLKDSRKGRITVKQLLNHTSGICPEATGAPNDGSWEYILGQTGDKRTAQLAFDPGSGCGYSTHALHHAALVCETVTGLPYDQFAIKALLQPLGIEHWWFQYFDSQKHGRHPTHGMGMPARDLARIGYCMLRDGRWEDRQVIPKWLVDETAAATHDVKSPEMRWKLNPEIFSHGWELPARHAGESGRSGAGIPADARAKPGSGGQLIAFVPSLDLVVTRQTGGSGDWQYEEFLRRACAAVE